MAHAGGYIRRVSRRRWLVASAAGAWAWLACAGRSQPAASLVAVRFTVFAPRPLKGVAFVPRPGAAPQVLKFLATARSPRYEYRGPMPLRLVDAETRLPVAEAVVPTGLREVLLMLLPLDAAGSASGGLRYQVAVLDDSASRHGAGGLAVINLSGFSLSGTVNDQSVRLQAGLNPTLPIGQSAKIRLTTTVKQRAHQAYAGQVNLGRGERALLVLFPPYYPGSMEVQSRVLVDRPGAAGTAGK